MSWDQPAFSFEQRQPPTPTRTPTSPSFTDFFQTPKVDSTFYDSRTGWNAPDGSSFSPLISSKTSKPPSFGLESGKGSFGKESVSASPALRNNRTLGAEFAANIRNILTTPDFSSLQVDHPDSFTNNGASSQVPAASATPAQLGLSLDTSFGNRSARSMQTPPPTTVSATKKQAQQNSKAVHQSPGNAGRRMSAPSVPQLNAAESTPKATRNRGVEESPAHFAALNFSPDAFGYNFVAPATAPAYPQHKLFWEPSEDHHMDGDFPSIPNPFDGPTPTIMSDHPALSTSQATSSSMIMDMSHNMMASSFGPHSFVSTAHQPPASSRPATTGVDPSLLFSSPSRLPAPPSSGPEGDPRVLNEDSLQPYAYQLQEAKRDKVYAGVAKPRKRRKPSVDSPAVKAALEHLREDAGEGERPAIRRSFTESALPRMNRDFREGSGPARPDSRHGRSSPLKRIPEAKRERERERKARHRTSIALTIDANGRARAETRVLGGTPGAESNENAMDVDTPSDATSSTDGDEDVVVSNFAGRPGASAGAGPKMGRFGRAPSSALHSHTSSAASMPAHRASMHDPPFLPHSRPATAGPLHGGARPFGLPPLHTGAARPAAPSVVDSDDSEAETVVSATAAPGPPSLPPRAEADTAQSELRKVLQGRPPAPSAPPYHGARPGAGVSFAPRDHSLAKLSPTTVTDPDLATPGGSSVRGGLSAGGSSSAGAVSSLAEAIRCVCGDMRDDGRPMIQCESCSQWLHVRCTGLNAQRLPHVYLCLICTGHTPAVRGGRVRDPAALAGAAGRKVGFEGMGGGMGGLESPLAGRVARGR